jgi:phosphoketolase
MPDFRDYACQLKKPGAEYAGPTEILAHFLRDMMREQPGQLPRLRPG